MGLNIDEQKAVERFKTQIVEPSMTKLVILDFWAEWCGPCKALTPVLEKVAADYADKGVILAKVNVDEEKFIASQFQVRSIPTVYAMFQGQPVADLTSARSESQIKQAIDQLLEKLPLEAGAGDAEPQQDIGQLVAMGEQILADGDGERAAGVFAQIAEMAPDNAAAHAGLIRALALAGHAEPAQAAYDGLPAEIQKDPLVEAAKSALDLAAEKPADAELEALRAAAKVAGDDPQPKYDFATAAFAAGERDEAVQALLTVVEQQPEWNEGAAKAKLLQIFEAVGLEDPWVAEVRRKLSLILFG